MSRRGQLPVGEKAEHRLVVQSDLRDPPDLRMLSRAVIELAKEIAEATTIEEERNERGRY